MTAEQLVRDQLDRATHDVPGGPDLESAVAAGRRRRRHRRAGLAIAAVAVLGVGALGVSQLTRGGTPTVHDDGAVAAQPAPAPADDFVPGTETDETMAAVIADHLPGLPAPDDVYPSDSHTAGPLPDADFAAAQDWQATYTIGDNTFLVIMANPDEGPFECDGCHPQNRPTGTLYHQDFQDTSTGEWGFGTLFQRQDGWIINAFEYVTAADAAAAGADRQLAAADLQALVQDPRLTFG